MPNDVYLTGTGLWLPRLHPVSEAVERGLYGRHQLAETQLESVAISAEVHPPDMAVRAARLALAAVGDPVRDISLTLHASLTYQGMEMWPAAAYVHQAAVGNSAPALDVQQMSSGGVAALILAEEYLRARPARRAALITTGDRFHGPRMNRWSLELGLVVGDGGTAVVLSRDPGFATIVASAALGDYGLEPSYRDRPFGDLAARDDVISLADRERSYLRTVPLDAVIERINAGIAQVVKNALDDAGLAAADIDRWLFPHVGEHNLKKMYLEPLGLPMDLDRTAWSLARTVGHLGAGDQFAALHHLRQTGALSTGDHCALLAVGAGFSYNCVILRIE